MFYYEAFLFQVDQAILPGNSSELRKMVERGICGFKCFLIHSGVEEFPSVYYAQVEEALGELSGTKSVLLVCA